MTGALKYRLRMWGLDRPWSWVALLVAAIYTVAVVGGSRGDIDLAVRLFALVQDPYWGYIVFLTPPLVLWGAAAMSRGGASPALRAAGGWAAMVLGAIVALVLVRAIPLVAAVIPGLILSAILCARFPAAAVSAAFLMTGTYGSVQAFTGFGVGPAVDVVLVGLWLGLAWNLVTRRREQRRVMYAGVGLLIAFLVISAFEILIAESVNLGLQAYRASSWYLLGGLLIAYAGWSAATYRRIASGIALVALTVGAYATLRWIIGPSGDETALAVSSAGVYNTVGGELRLFGSLTSGHELAAWCAAAVPFSAAYALTVTGLWRLIGAAAAGFCMVGLLGSEVRIGIIAVAAGLAVCLTLYQLAPGFRGLHLGVSATAIVAVAVAGVAIFSFTAGRNDESLSRYENILHPDRDPAFQARLVKWETALDDIERHPFGRGIGTGGRAVSHARFTTIGSSNIDNAYLKVAFEQGFAVLGLYVLGLLLMLGGLIRGALATVHRQSAGFAIAASGTLVSLMVLFFAALYNEGLTALAAWMIVGVGLAPFAVIRDASPSGD